ncbi:MAG TPA: hypothetical protein VGJ20_40975 [Xanthobacteraceae bacterium]
MGQLIEALRSIEELPYIEVERSFDVEQLSALPTITATAIPTMKIVEGAAIMLAEVIVAAPS